MNIGIWNPLLEMFGRVGMSDYSDVTDLFCLRDYGETLVTIKRDGTIEYGDKYTPDDAAKVFWSKIQHHDRIAKLLSEIDFVRAENEKLRNEVMSDYHEGWEEGLSAMQQEVIRLREENENLRADLEDTKSLLANKPISFLRPTENHDWWCVSIMERRKRVAAEKENEKLRTEVMSDYHEGLEEGIKAERERCAKIAESYFSVQGSYAMHIAAAIRE